MEPSERSLSSQSERTHTSDTPLQPSREYFMKVGDRLVWAPVLVDAFSREDLLNEDVRALPGEWTPEQVVEVEQRLKDFRERHKVDVSGFPG